MTRAVGLVVGVGARRGVSADEVLALVRDVLREAGLPCAAVVEVATVASKAAEPGLVEAAARLGVPLRGRPAEELARVVVPHPSERRARRPERPPWPRPRRWRAGATSSYRSGSRCPATGPGRG